MEEAQESQVSQNIDTEVVPSTQQSPVIQEALSMGWVPKEDYEGDPDRWVDAGEFIRRGELFRKIESQSKEMKDLRKALNELAKHNSKVREIEYDRAVKHLKEEKKKALSEADADRVIEIDDQIDLVKDQQRQHQAYLVQQVQEQTQQELHPELRTWMDNNPWYGNNRTMKAWADARGIELAEQGNSPTDVLKLLTKEVKDRFKEKFQNPNRTKASAVEGNVSRGGTKEADLELSDIEKTVMKTLVSGGHITKEEYLKQLKAVREKK